MKWLRFRRDNSNPARAAALLPDSNYLARLAASFPNQPSVPIISNALT